MNFDINKDWQEHEEEQRKQEEDKSVQEVARKISEYRSNRLGMMTDIKKYRHIIEHIVHNGVETTEEQRVARIACCILAADLFVEDAIMEDKTGKMSDVLKSPDIIDDILDDNA